MCRGRSRGWPMAALSVTLLWAGITPAAQLQGSEWKPLRMGGMTMPESPDAFVQFRSKGRLEGHSGCNRIFADYEVDDGHIFIGHVAATRMVCEQARMEREAELARALENARTYQRMRHKLVLFDHAGNPILEMRQTDWD